MIEKCLTNPAVTLGVLPIVDRKEICDWNINIYIYLYIYMYISIISKKHPQLQTSDDTRMTDWDYPNGPYSWIHITKVNKETPQVGI